MIDFTSAVFMGSTRTSISIEIKIYQIQNEKVSLTNSKAK